MTVRPSKRSVSPFGLKDTIEGPFVALHRAFARAFEKRLADQPSHLKSFEDAPGLPFVFEEVWAAPSNDCPRLSPLCEYLILHRSPLQEKGLEDILYQSMLTVFDQKTELFLIDHHNEDNCKKMGWSETHRDVVLYAKERDALVGHYFSKMAEQTPGRFSEFVSRWIQTQNMDRILHFFDFCKGARHPTFEHYLLFAHPTLGRLLRDKAQLKELLDRAAPLLKKLTSPTWERDVRTALEI